MSKINSAVSARYPLPDCPLSAVELLAFYPHHVVWPDCLLRFVANGWNMSLVAKGQMYARDNLDQAEHTRRCNALRKAKKTAGNVKFGVKDFDASLEPWASIATLQPFIPIIDHAPPWTQKEALRHLDMYNPARCATPWIPPPNISLSTTHPTLRMVLNGVVNFPQDEDAGALTHVIKWAIEQNALDDYTTAHIQTIAANPNNRLQAGHRLNMIPRESLTHTWDQHGAERTEALPRGW